MAVEISEFLGATPNGLIANSFRPKLNKAGQVVYPGALATNARLDAREWKLFDTAVMESARTKLIGIADLQSAGLVKNIPSIGIFQVDQRVQSERVASNITMETTTRTDSDRVERKTISIPIPVISTNYQIGERELAASRMMGMPLDTAEAIEAARSVAETLEGMYFNGTTAVVFNGLAIKGLNNATNAATDTATNYGGGAWITGDNAYNSIKGAISAMDSTRRFRGPFMIYCHPTDYFKLLAVRANSDMTQLDLIMKLPQVRGVQMADPTNVTAGTSLFVQMTPDVVELQQTLPIQNRQWMSPDESVFHAKVLTIAVPFLKTNYAGNSGVLKMTGM